MAALHSTHDMHPDSHQHHCSLGGHLIPTTRTPACDHCTYFKGVAYRTQTRLTDPDQGPPKPLERPRSLLSIALEEEATEKREHAKYLFWSRSTHPIPSVAQTLEAKNVAKSLALYTEQSDTLTTWIESSTKEELLAWLSRNGNENDDMDTLRHEGIFDLREYVLHKRSSRAVPKSQKSAVAKSTTLPAGEKEMKHTTPRLEALERRLQNHASIKPPQAALRQREELTRWYESMKAPVLKHELRARGVRPVPGRKGDMVIALVEDDKK